MQGIHANQLRFCALFGQGELAFNSDLLRNATNEQTAVIHTHTNTQSPSLPNLVVVQLPYALLRRRNVSVHDERVTSVEARIVHHEPELVDLAHLVEDWHELVLEAVSWDLSHEHLAPARRRLSLPVRRRSVASLAILLDDAVAGTLHEASDRRGGVFFGAQRGLGGAGIAHGCSAPQLLRRQLSAARVFVTACASVGEGTCSITAQRLVQYLWRRLFLHVPDLATSAERDSGSPLSPRS